MQAGIIWLYAGLIRWSRWMVAHRRRVARWLLDGEKPVVRCPFLHGHPHALIVVSGSISADQSTAIAKGVLSRVLCPKIADFRTMAPYVVCTVTLKIDHSTPWDVTFWKRFAARGVQSRGLPPLASAV